jgi:group I intron endonuclease
MPNARRSGLYVIRNTVTGAFYLGSSADVAKRWQQHASDLRRGVHCNSRLQRSWAKYGAEAFVFDVIRDVPPEALQAAEEEALREAIGDRACVNATAEYRGGMRRLTARNVATRGSQHTPEARAKIAAANSRRTLSAETRARIGAARLGRPLSDETRARIAEGSRRAWESRTNRECPPEVRAKISATKRRQQEERRAG